MDAGIDLDLDNNHTVASRGDDRNGDGVMDYQYGVDDFFWFFSGPEPYWEASKKSVTISDKSDPRYLPPDTSIDRIVTMNIRDSIDAGTGLPVYDTTYSYLYDTTITFPAIDYTYEIYADLNKNGLWDRTPIVRDADDDGRFDLPASGDFEYWRWEMLPFWRGEKFDFSHNEFAVVVDRSAVTKDGVAYARLTYPRQFARRLNVTVNAEANGIRDRDGERFALPILRD
jgi:hypothetical protein